MVYGQAVMEMPLDLYIPPDALEVFLEASIFSERGSSKIGRAHV